MKKIIFSIGKEPVPQSIKCLIIMKLITLLILASIFQVQAKGFAQTVSLSKKKVSIVEVFREIKKQTNYNIISTSKLIKGTPLVSIEVKNASLEDALNALLIPNGLTYHLEDKAIVIKREKVKVNLKVLDDKTSLIQQREVKGKVTDEEGDALGGVSIRVKGKSIAVSTTESGLFSLPVETGDVLLFSYVGFVSQEITYSGQAEITVRLESDVTSMDEVVVVGYGTQKKVNLTGSVSAISGEDLVKKPVGQTSAALQGTVPGLTVRQMSGQPGRDGGNLLIRGVGTMGDGMGPLVLVDGVETGINNVDPNEIESISVLKDASSAAIYGSRAAGGVILVTTKRANELGLKVNYNTYGGWQLPTDMVSMVNGLDHMNLMNEAYTNTGRSPLYSQTIIDEYSSGRFENPDKYPDTDWRKITMKNSGFMQSHHVGISSGSEKVKILGSLGYINQDGLIPNTNFERYSFRLNTDLKINEKLSSSIDLSLLKTHLTEPSSGANSVFHWMRRIPANEAGFLSTGQYGEGWNGDNPIAKAKDGGLNLIEPISSIINLDLKYAPTDWLSASLVYSPKFSISHNKSFTEVIQTYKWDGSKGFATPSKNSLRESYSQNWYNNLRLVLTFDKNIAQDHHVTALGGYQQEDQKDNSLSAYREVFLLPQYQEIDAGDRDNELTGGTASHWALRSFFGRVNYSFKGRYLFEANARYDGSSRFASGNQYAFFPSFSAGWRISQEPFMKDLLRGVKELKIRGSWGKLGNQNIGLYPFAAFIGLGNSNYIFDNQMVGGASLNEMANSEIKWETTTVTDIGIDLDIGNKFSVTADYYYRKTTDILLRLAIPEILGLSAPYQNAGVVENKGWDLSTIYRDHVGQFKYNITLSLSDVKNKVLDMKGVKRSGLQVNHEGYPINSIFGYEAIGYFKNNADVESHATQFGNVAPGDIRYRDINGDGKIDHMDETIIGSHLPRYTYSANFDLGYKNLDFSLFLQGVGKADGYLFGQGIMAFYEGGTVQEQHKDRWTPENTNAAFPRFAFNETNNIQNSTFWLKSAAYMRIKNIQLGYTIPSSKLPTGFNNIRVFASGQNLFTFNKFWDGYDPEGPVGNGSWYPQTKVYTVGLNVNF